MAAITSQQTAAAFDAARLVAGGNLTSIEAINSLVTNFGMNRGSAANYLQSLKDMAEGRGYSRAINLAAADHFISRFLDTEGIDVARLAVRSLRDHIAGYEQIRNVTMQSLRALAFQWDAKLDSRDVDDWQPEFDAEVAKLLDAIPSVRKAKLPPPGHKPKIGYARVRIYRRSPAVVAEVLIRSDGLCESCNQPAPFLKAKDGRPFLEVHHKEQLANGGEDTVDNAIAVCPNCHRKHHFG